MAAPIGDEGDYPQPYQQPDQQSGNVKYIYAAPPGRASSSGRGDGSHVGSHTGGVGSTKDQDSEYQPSMSGAGETAPLKYDKSVINQDQIIAEPQDDYMQGSKHYHIDRRIVLGTMLFSVLTMGLQLCVIVVPHWWVAMSYSQGLWMRCSYFAQWMNCVDTDFQVTDFLHAARALEVISGIIYFFAMICAILHMAMYHRSFWIKVGIAGGIAVGGLFCFVGAVAYIGKVKETNSQSVPGAAFILAIINSGISWAFAVAACLNFRKF